MFAQIRNATLEDSLQIVNAEKEIALQPGLFCSAPDEFTEIKVKETIQANKGVYLVAVIESKLVGHAFLVPLSLKALKHVAMLNIAVHKGWQGKGIGTQLMQSLIDWAKKSKQIEKIELNVRATNKIALKLYADFGFTEEGRLKNHVKIDDHYIDDIVMGLLLPKSS